MLEHLHITLPNNPVVPPNVDFINNLPPELLSRIFEVGCGDTNVETDGGSEDEGDGEKTDDEGDSDASKSSAFLLQWLPFQILASHVCHYWRTVALSTPSLWTTIVVPLEARPQYERVSTLLERSKCLLIDVCVHCDTVEYEDDERHSDVINSLYSLLASHIHRWRTMAVSVSDYCHIHSFFSAVSDPSIAAAPLLTTLELSFNHFGYYGHSGIGIPQNLTPFGGSTPLLTRLVLRAVRVDWNQPWIASISNLKDLELANHTGSDRPSWVQFAAILRGAPALERLSLRQSGPSGDPTEWFIETTPESPVDLNAPIQLLQVTNLTLALHSEVYAIGLLRKFYLPALKNLDLQFHKGDYTDLVRELARPATPLLPSQEQLHSLLSRLESLKIGGLPCNTSSIKMLYGELQNLASLDLSLSWGLPTLFLDILCAQSGLPGRGDVWLPRLVTLHISRAPGGILRKLVQKRKDAGVPLDSLSVEKLHDVTEEDVQWLKKNVKAFTVLTLLVD